MREIERRIQRTEAQNSKRVLTLDAPLGVPETFEDHAAMMFDLLAVAYQADITRVFTFMMAREASQRTYPALNIPQTHHDVSHHGGNADNMERHAKVNTALCPAVRDVPREAAGDARGRRHGARPLADLLRRRHERRPGARAVSASAGRPSGAGGGTVKGNRHIVAPEWTPVANLWLGVANLYGVDLDSFAESTGAS